MFPKSVPEVGRGGREVGRVNGREKEEVEGRRRRRRRRNDVVGSMVVLDGNRKGEGRREREGLLGD